MNRPSRSSSGRTPHAACRPRIQSLSRLAGSASPIGSIHAVTFDFGGTLIEPWPSVGHVYAEVAARHGLKNLSAEQLNTRFKAAWRARQNFRHLRNEWEELVTEVFDRSTPVGFFAELYERFAEPD